MYPARSKLKAELSEDVAKPTAKSSDSEVICEHLPSRVYGTFSVYLVLGHFS